MFDPEVARTLYSLSQDVVAFYYIHERAIRDACKSLPDRPAHQPLNVYVTQMAVNIARKLDIDRFTAGLLASMLNENTAA